MANVRVANASLQAGLDAITALIGGTGTIKIYTGVQPADGDAILSGNTLLGTLTFSATAFGATTTAGVATANAITGDTAADATGTATWARIQSGAAANVFDCDVGTTGATINLNTVSIITGGTIDVTSFTLTLPDGT